MVTKITSNNNNERTDRANALFAPHRTGNWSVCSFFYTLLQPGSKSLKPGWAWRTWQKLPSCGLMLEKKSTLGLYSFFLFPFIFKVFSLSLNWSYNYQHNKKKNFLICQPVTPHYHHQEPKTICSRKNKHAFVCVFIHRKCIPYFSWIYAEMVMLVWHLYKAWTGLWWTEQMYHLIWILRNIRTVYSLFPKNKQNYSTNLLHVCFRFLLVCIVY